MLFFSKGFANDFRNESELFQKRNESSLFPGCAIFQ